MFDFLSKRKKQNNKEDKIAKLTKAERKKLKPISFKMFEKKYTMSGDDNIQLSKNMYYALTGDGRAHNILFADAGSAALNLMVGTFIKDAPKDARIICFDRDVYEAVILELLKNSVPVYVLDADIMMGSGQEKESASKTGGREYLHYDPMKFVRNREDDASLAKILIEEIPEEYPFSSEEENNLFQGLEIKMLSAYICYVRNTLGTATLKDLQTTISAATLSEINDLLFDEDEISEAVREAIAAVGDLVNTVTSCLRYKMETIISKAGVLTESSTNGFIKMIEHPGILFVLPCASPVARALSLAAVKDVAKELSLYSGINILHVASAHASSLVRIFGGEDKLADFMNNKSIGFVTYGKINGLLSMTVGNGENKEDDTEEDLSETFLDESTDMLRAVQLGTVQIESPAPTEVPGRRIREALNAPFISLADVIVVGEGVEGGVLEKVGVNKLVAPAKKGEVLVIVNEEENPIRDQAI